MINSFLTALALTPEYRGEISPELRARISSDLPKAAVRRMSDSGLGMASVLSAVATGVDDAVAMASTFAESRSLEDFIDSFPTPSPAKFQRSVHPSAVQQARVAGLSPLRTFIPVAGLD
ncbi:MAG TPA: hypothetical protein PKI32_09520, partial [Opitutales bacterium]|nr:hypothetical protein [Opitutales bacterium]